MVRLPVLLLAVGFQPTLLNLPAAQVPRSQTPCLAIIRDQPAVIYRIEKGEVLAVLPEFGRVSLSLEEWIGGQAGVQLLMVAPGSGFSAAQTRI